MKNHITLHASLSVLLIAAVTACSVPLVPDFSSIPPSGTGTTAFGTPTGLSASQGQKQAITLSWEPVRKVSRYQIYRADTPFESFVQVGETDGTEVKFSHVVSAGSTGYYRISAVSMDGKESAPSSAVLGTSLAQPAVTAIEPDADVGDSKVTVYWWMENVSADTYQQQVRYLVTCSDGSKVVSQAVVDGSVTAETAAVFENLNPNTTYRYSVEAYLATAQNDTETSATVDAATARRLRPNAPEKLAASEGSGPDHISLSFTLPSMVDVAVSSGVYEQHPLYFKIFRRVAVESGTIPAWEPLCSYFGTDSALGETFASTYVPGTTVTWVDSTANALARGKKYEYRVQSYADNTTRVISSSLSSAETTGWLISVPSIRVSPVVNVLSADGLRNIRASLSFTADWESFGKESLYDFILQEKRFRLEVDNSEATDSAGFSPTVTAYDTLAELNAAVRSFELEPSPADTRGYYSYSLSVVPAGASSASAALVTVAAPGQSLVIDSVDIQKITGFSVKGGFRDKFEISWDYDHTCAYSLSWYPVDADGNKSGDETAIADLSSIVPAGGADAHVTYVDAAASGDCRAYLLRAKKQITVSALSPVARTLGTPAPKFARADLSYDAITVRWAAVQEAKSYTVSFAYDNASSLPVSSLIAGGETVDLTKPIGTKSYAVSAAEVTPAADGTISYTFSAPAGSRNARVSGRPVTVTVSAKSETDETSGTVAARTLGPALISAVATKAASATEIVVSWQTVPDAAGYIVARSRKAISPDGTETLASCDSFFVSAAGAVSIADEVVDASRVSASLSSGAIILKDKYCAATDATVQYQKNQEKIAWGLPYEYLVVPVLESTDSLADTSARDDEAMIAARGFALGYGLNVSAAKAENTGYVDIGWTAPGLSPDVSAVPVLYAKLHSASDSSWRKLTTGTGVELHGETKFRVIPEDACEVYDYAVCYAASGIAARIPVSSYLENFASSVDENGEQVNSGYLFSLPAFTAYNVKDGSGNATFAEKAEWELYDLSTRKRGPVSYTVSILNHNKSASWTDIATITPAGIVTLMSGSNWNVSMTSAGNVLKLAPSNVTALSGIDSGLLQVLRDYRHYYRISATRTNTAGEAITASIGDDLSVSASRQISGEEFAKAAMLVLSYGLWDFHDGENLSTTGKTVSGNGGGTMTYSRSTLLSTGYSFSAHVYDPAMATPSGKAATFLALTCAGGKLDVPSILNCFPKSFDSVALSLAGPSDSGVSGLGTGSVTFSSSSSTQASLVWSYNGLSGTITANTAQIRRAWVPVRYGADDQWYLTSADDGWW